MKPEPSLNPNLKSVPWVRTETSLRTLNIVWLADVMTGGKTTLTAVLAI